VVATTSASGLAAATRSERVEMLVINQSPFVRPRDGQDTR